jgi:hypothetical protein
MSAERSVSSEHGEHCGITLSVQRRTFLAGSLLAAWRPALIPAREKAATVTVDVDRRMGGIAADFIGLGFEISSVAIPRLLSARNRTYVQLVRNLSREGAIRVGGNTSDDASYTPDRQAVSAPKGTVVNDAMLQQLGTFLQATNWQLIWGLNLGSGDERQAAAEAEAVAGAANRHLLAFEIGNEPDLFGRGTGHRSKSYGYDDYLKEFRRYRAAVRAKLPHAPFAGPDAASETDWVLRFANDEGSDITLLTHHYYRQCAGPTSTLDKLLGRDPKLAPELEKLQLASSTAHVPYRICEVNSFCGGGKEGVSDSFGAALWVLDYLFQLASAGCAGVNIETGVNQLGFVSWYSPIRQNEAGAFGAAPEYYGMLAFAEASRGTLVGVNCDAAGANLSAYAVAAADRSLFVTIVNKEATLDASVNLMLPRNVHDGRVLRLMAPSLQANAGVLFGGSAVSADGTWRPSSNESVEASNGRASIRVSAGSAALVKWPGKSR